MDIMNVKIAEYTVITKPEAGEYISEVYKDNKIVASVPNETTKDVKDYIEYCKSVLEG